MKKYMLIVLFALLWISSSLFLVSSRESAVVTQFGDPVSTLSEPGLKLKLPWPIQEVELFDSRSQLLELGTTEAFTKDTKVLVLTPFVVWKISDPKLFLERVRQEQNAAVLLQDLVIARLASAIGEISFSEVLRTEGEKRDLLPPQLLEEVNKETLRLGILVERVQLQKLALPVQNEQSIYERMRAERSRIAKRYRSEGEEQAVAIRAKADREAAEIEAEARRAAAEIRAKAEQMAAQRYAETYKQDPELYELLHDIEAAEVILEEGGTLIIDAEHRPFSTLFNNE